MKAQQILGALVGLVIVGCASPAEKSFRGNQTGSKPPRILSTYQDHWFKPTRYRRPGGHAGVDFGAYRSVPVLAAAPGEVSLLLRNSECGIGVVFRHENGFFTAYCHLRSISVTKGDTVERGRKIGTNGSTGNAPFDWPHVHFEVSFDGLPHPDGSSTDLHDDPMDYLAGCFDPAKTYPTFQFVITYPLPC